MRALFDELNQEEMFPGLPDVKMWNPVVEMAELDEELRLTAELPGMTRDDVEIAVEHNVLTLRGERVEKKEKEEKKIRYHVWERVYGKFQRSFTLSSNIDAEKISAEIDDGVLTVHIPKTAESKAHRIEISAS